MKTSGLRAILSDLIRSCRIYGAFKRLGQVRPSKDERGRVRQRFGWQDRRCWPTTRRLTRPRLDSDSRQIGTWGVLPMSGGRRRLRSLPRNMMRLCHISDIHIDYAERRSAGGGIPVAARRAMRMAGIPGLRGCGDIPGRPPRKLEGQAPPGRDICLEKLRATDLPVSRTDRA
jgi:hypothetical protein